MIVAIPRFIGPIPLDVVIMEEHESELEITQNPIEFGADVTDHAYVQPKRLTLEAVAAGFSSNPVLVAASYQSLVRLQESREPFDIISGLGLYGNMLIRRISVKRDKMNARVLHFEAELLQIIIVSTKRGASGDRGQGTISRGNTAGGEVSAAEAADITQKMGQK